MNNKNNKYMKKQVDNQPNRMEQENTSVNVEMASYVASDDDKNERHNNNARALAAVEPEYPRINTDNL
ncbi:hypothetical protein [Paraliobacillus sediminis]|uniref:hypothetical protein n=1 Tax=Paraliobacillus sediminis TaxID=1885916 RepID=UPI000E3EB9DA|nr:hypothetical protein [Paraliobacillus sediminis]